MQEANSRVRIDIEYAIEQIKKANAKRILIQVPEGLKDKLTEIVEALQHKCKNAEFFCQIDPIYGACDLAENESVLLNADLVLHFGHSQMVESRKTVYVPVTYVISDREIEKSAKKIIEYLGENKIKSVTFGATIQYVPYLQKIKALLEKEGIIVNISRAGVLEYGQVLGCNINALLQNKENELTILFADGYFHAKFAALVSKKKVIQIDLINAKIEEIKQDQKLVRKRIASIMRAEKAEAFGVLICTKEGQFNFEKALELKKLIEERGRKAFLFFGDLILPEYLLGIKVDCFVSTACPRIALDESDKWKRPLLNAEELLITLGIKKLEEYSLI